MWATNSTTYIFYQRGTGVVGPGDPGFDGGDPLTRTLMVTLFVLLPAAIGVFIRMSRDTTTAARERAKIAESEREARAKAAVLLDRQRIAGEMHDSLGHKLALISTQAGGLEVNADRGTEFVSEHARVIGETARTALTELRQAVGSLDPPPPPHASWPEQIQALLSSARSSLMTIPWCVPGSE